MPKTVSFKTFGCKQNQYDTDFLRESFERRGFVVIDDVNGLASNEDAATADNPSERRLDAATPDIVVINTCAVTSKGAAKCRQAIRAAGRSGAKVVVTGCYSQVAPQEIESIPGVIAVAGVRGRGELAEIVEKALESGKSITEVVPHELGASFGGGRAIDLGEVSEPFEETPMQHPSLTRAFLKIQEGCGDFCAYCIVPYARGPSRSRPAGRVLDEARALVGRGYNEIVLTGTHIGLYGNDRPQESLGQSGRSIWPSQSVQQAFPSLPNLIRCLCDINGLMRLRISSLEPHDVDDDFLDCLRFPQVCPHLHLPLQSGSDTILRAMGRRYDVRGFLDVVEKARAIAPDAGMTTDIIVGFPGETEEDFENTLDVARRAAFSRIHAFKFSPRPGTRAYEFGDKVPEKEKDERIKRLLALGKELSLTFHRKHVSRVLEVLVEDDRAKNGQLTGVTRNYIRCDFAGGDELKGSLVPVLIRRAVPSSVEGILSS